MNPVTEDRWRSMEEVSAYLGVKIDTLYKWVGRKDFPARKVGRLWKVKFSDVDRWVQESHATKRGKKK